MVQGEPWGLHGFFSSREPDIVGLNVSTNRTMSSLGLSWCCLFLNGKSCFIAYHIPYWCYMASDSNEDQQNMKYFHVDSLILILSEPFLSQIQKPNIHWERTKGFFVRLHKQQHWYSQFYLNNSLAMLGYSNQLKGWLLLILLLIMHYLAEDSGFARVTAGRRYLNIICFILLACTFMHCISGFLKRKGFGKITFYNLLPWV